MDVIWYSRHAPTVEQIKEIENKGQSIVALEAGMALGARNLQTDAEVAEVVKMLRQLAADNNAVAYYGVFPAPIQEIGGNLPCFAAWNVCRSVEGGKPTFTHLRFCRVGSL